MTVDFYQCSIFQVSGILPFLFIPEAAVELMLLFSFSGEGYSSLSSLLSTFLTNRLLSSSLLFWVAFFKRQFTNVVTKTILHLKMVEDPKEFLFVWAISINIFTLQIVLILCVTALPVTQECLRFYLNEPKAV